MRRSARISALTSNLTRSNQKRKAEDEQAVVPIKQLNFDGPFHRQNLPFRDSLINYITKNPSNAKAWTKLIQSSKYFFAKNPVFVIDKLECESEKWMASLNEIQKRVDFTKTSSKLWITDKFDTYYASLKNLSSIISHIFRCDVKYLHLKDNVISYEDFLFFLQMLKISFYMKILLKIQMVLLFHLKNFLQLFQKLRGHVMTKKDSSCITKNTVKELLQIPHFSIIDKLYIFQLPETFDTETFFKCSKKNKNTLYSLRFCDTLSEAYKNRVEAIVDEIIETEGYDYKVPSICFVGLSEEKWDKLVKLILKY